DITLQTESEVLGTLLGKVTLGCQILGGKSAMSSTVSWQKDGQLIYTQLGNKGTAHSGYEGRASVDSTKLASGDISLILSNATITDKGTYTCQFESAKKNMELKLGHLGSRPVFVMKKISSPRSLTLSCNSEGWYPRPTISWTASNGQTLHPEFQQETGPRGMLQVQSKVTLTAEEGLKVSCRMNNPTLGAETQETLKISGEFPPDVSPWLIAFWVVFFLIVIAAAVAFYFFKKKRDAIKEKERQAKEAERQPLLEHSETDKKNVKEDYEKLKKELSDARLVNDSEWKRIQSKKVANVSLTKNSVGPEFSDGNRYWEVDVGDRKEWKAGVKKKDVAVNKDTNTNDSVWALSCGETSGYCALLPTPFPITPAEPPKKLGCLLDYKEGQLTFYDAERKHRLYTFDAKFEGPVQPFYQ
ncbi:BT1A1 protein, partial [Atractosteus spatula]|nr:BT1A1 protein [Atractosteus spatula]